MPGQKSIIQGDTLSPLIFLVAFNPIIKVVQSLPSSGFRLLLPPPSNSRDLPEVNSFVYTLWDEPQSDEPSGWYLAKVTYISDDGNAVIRYKRGSLEESVNLSNVSWVQAKGNEKWFIPMSSSPPVMAALEKSNRVWSRILDGLQYPPSNCPLF